MSSFGQMEIAKRLNAIIAQLLPFLNQEVSSEPGARHAASQGAQNTTVLHRYQNRIDCKKGSA